MLGDGRVEFTAVRGTVEVILVDTPERLQQALAVRRRVFIEEQGVPPEIEIDEFDAEPGTREGALHVLGLLEGRPIATGRLLFEGGPGHGHIGRIAVLEEHRRRGHGRAIMLALHREALSRDVRLLTLAAQLHALGFYERLGYVARGEVFLDAGIEHRWMDLELE